MFVSLLGVMLPNAAHAQGQSPSTKSGYPVRPVRLVVPYPPGGGSDTASRAIAAQLAASLGQPFVADNRAGAGGALGDDIVAKAAPDGYTLLMGSNSMAVNVSLLKSLPHDPLRDFAAIGLVGEVPYLLVVHPSLAVKSVVDLIALAKAKPDELRCATGGMGSTLHLSAELFRAMTSVRFTRVPYKGGVPAVTAVIAGEVHFVFGSLTTTVPAAKAGRVRAIATTGATRSALVADLPTMAESGLPGFDATNWYGLMAPAGTPGAIIGLLNAELNKILAVPAFRERMMATQGIEPLSSTPAELAAYLKKEVAKWARVVKQAGIRAD
jgi:tripartite-type tricarboxylate transporter receptor subunit TctC